MTVTEAELGRRLRDARESWKLTQAEVATTLGLSRSAISEIEAGRRGVSGLELHRLAHLYGRDMADFLEGDFKQGGAVAALFRRNPSVVLGADALEALRRCLALGREAANLRRKLGRDPASTNLPAYASASPSSRWAAVEQGSEVAMAERRRLGLESGLLPDVARILESQGVWTVLVSFPDDISGLAVLDARTGFLVAVNHSHPFLRRRFSFAHEYAHVLFDREAEGIVSSTSQRNDLRDVRANAFAAAFLMPDVAVRSFVASLWKGRPSRMRAEIYDEDAPLRITARLKSDSQKLQAHDVVLIAHHFNVSCPAVLYRLRSLKMITEQERSALANQHESGVTRNLRALFGLSESNDIKQRERFMGRFLHLALEAYRQEKITMCKLKELVRLAARDNGSHLSAILDSLGPAT